MSHQGEGLFWTIPSSCFWVRYETNATYHFCVKVHANCFNCSSFPLRVNSFREKWKAFVTPFGPLGGLAVSSNFQHTDCPYCHPILCPKIQLSGIVSYIMHRCSVYQVAKTEELFPAKYRFSELKICIPKPKYPALGSVRPGLNQHKLPPCAKMRNDIYAISRRNCPSSWAQPMRVSWVRITRPLSLRFRGSNSAMPNNMWKVRRILKGMEIYRSGIVWHLLLMNTPLRPSFTEWNCLCNYQLI